MNTYKWNNIGSQEISEKSGIYAWYYKPKIGLADIEKLKIELHSKESTSLKKEVVETFLQNRLFRFFSQPDYDVTARGPLMPRYEGKLSHIDSISIELVDKILEDPDSTLIIRDTLSILDVFFLSPIYVGMAKNLSRRINNHKSLIETAKVGNKFEGEIEERDRCFAERVAQRKMVETYLEVVVCEIDGTNNEHNLAENLINRISYPILGRN
ncbi:hypothetical protein [Vibrio campbellii]|uniref:hypothetical protein n=1 Tax=Vibrio campbellii TaxID=680 RepID=UPI0038CD2E97